MGERPSARTERELAELRGAIDADIRELAARAKADLDPRALIRRQPLAVFGTLGSLGLLGATALVRKLREAQRRRPDSEIDDVIRRLGGRVDRLTGKARKRLRAQLRTEIALAEKPRRTPRELAWTVSLSALTAGAAELARRYAGRLASDEVASDERSEAP